MSGEDDGAPFTLHPAFQRLCDLCDVRKLLVGVLSVKERVTDIVLHVPGEETAFRRVRVHGGDLETAAESLLAAVKKP